MDPVRCPTCAQDTDHDVLKATTASVTARCMDCHTVHTFSPPHLRIIEVPLVFSAEEQSRTDRIETPVDEEIAVGFEFDHIGHRMMVTGMEGRDGRHHQKLVARDVKVLHAKLFDTVPLKFSVNEGETTRSHRLDVDPDREIQVGEVFAVDGHKLKVKTLKSDQNRTIHRGHLLARNVRRAFCDQVPHWVREGKILSVRRRGKPTEPGKPTGKPTGKPRGKATGKAASKTAGTAKKSPRSSRKGAP